MHDKGRKTKILVSLDTEDFTQNHAADGIKILADLFHEEGVRANFCIVGLLARQLEEWGRTDVIDSLKAHEIGFHTYGHSLHPMIDEYTDIADYYAAERECMRQEGEGAREVMRVCGVPSITAAVAPGNAKSYVAMYSYAKLGIPVYSDTVCDTPDGQGTFYCNELNIAYTVSFESLFWRREGVYDPKKLLDTLASRRTAVLYTHPNYLLYRDWWDILNYDKENLRPFGEWIEGRRRDASQTEQYLTQLRELIRLIRADGRFEFVTYSELAAAYGVGRRRRLYRSDLPEIRRALGENFGHTVIGGEHYSVSDLFLALRDFLMGRDYHDAGFVYGFLDTPQGVTEPTRLSASAVIAAASAVNPDGFLPHVIDAGGVSIGPADLLFAMLDLLGADGTGGGKGGNADGSVLLTPRPQLNSTESLPDLCAFSPRGTWRHADSFRDEYGSRRLRLQCWTLRPAD